VIVAVKQRIAYTTKLAQLGRCDEAAAYGHAHLQTPDEALPTDAVNRYGIPIRSPHYELAVWLRGVAAQLGERERALVAAQSAFRAVFTLENYQHVRELASDAWADLRDELLELARQQSHASPESRVDIFLAEDLLDDAIAVTAPYLQETLRRATNGEAPEQSNLF